MKQKVQGPQKPPLKHLKTNITFLFAKHKIYIRVYEHITEYKLYPLTRAALLRVSV